ncbi:hypothetical protein [Ruminococcus flavefaciens]|uniref:hypothetical protein n=1 Tax=Ruminococcus flavefaciens TaxID=1265 RepID=UPI0013DC3746|nr:hypothetical protein [Ruminococcus flavefaciens]
MDIALVKASILSATYLISKNIIKTLDKGKSDANNIPQNDEPIIFKNTSNAPTSVNMEVTTTNTPINNGEPFEVKGFIRNLPDSRCPSAEKRAQAARLGIELGEHQTLVDPYMKNAV